MLLTFFSIVLRALHWLAWFKYVTVDHTKYRDHLELIGCNEHDIHIFNGL